MAAWLAKTFNPLWLKVFFIAGVAKIAIPIYKEVCLG